MTSEEKREERRKKELQGEYTIKFTKMELIMIHNILAVDERQQPRMYRIGDGKVIFDLLEKIRPIVAVDTNIEAPAPPIEDGLILEEKKESN